MSKYLVEIEGQQREPLAIRRLIDAQVYLPEILNPLGLSAPFSWYILEMRHEKLVEKCYGDTDLLVGSLSWEEPSEFEILVKRNMTELPNAHHSWHHQLAAIELAENGGIKWPPSTEYIIGFEAKCAYFDYQSNELKAIKASKSDAKNRSKSYLS